MDLGYPEGGDHKATELPYVINSQNQEDSIRMGGQVIKGLAGAALNVGDVVFLSAVDTFNKSATVANLTGLFGVVVGGDLTFGQIIQADSAIGVLPAAGVGQVVIVQVTGSVKVLADAALATFNTKVTGAATTAGRVGVAGGAAGNYIGYTLDVAAGAGSVIRIYLQRG